ncbi:MAG: alkaline phosphatase family protein [Gammaproteobacteria bacterium]|nr:alkaline phosphatase family protein [Gammaproteobacteria bacterium]
MPLVLAGPLLRRLEPQRLCLWLAVREAVLLRLCMDDGRGPQQYQLAPGEPGCRLLVAGERLCYLLIDLALEQPLAPGVLIHYELSLRPQADAASAWQGHADWAPDLCYPGQPHPCFQLPARLDALLHGSCRKPHYSPGDGLAQVDGLLARILAADPSDEELPGWPDLLVLSGDQIYADDVAGPLLWAIHQVIERLGLFNERLPGLERGLADAQALYQHADSYYGRERLLPRRGQHRALLDLFFGGVRKPIFTSDNAHNHLISLAEVLAMYLLVWSPAVWSGLSLEPPPGVSAKEQARYAEERQAIEEFIGYLPAVRRALAHLPTAMIFDDHDITDDWNLSREWEETAYGEPFSRRVIGNALFAYLVNQGWGNRPEAFDAELMSWVEAALAAPGEAAHENCLELLLRFDNWHYHWPTEPPLVVIDSRTRRWRSEVAAARPSGLLDWEGLTELQYSLCGLPAVVLVSPAPIFGVKLIELIQRLFTWLGKPLLVDAENWMAHPGAAHAMLNIFRHRKTPQHFIILSGDVHYSFVYDVELRGHRGGPHIWQISSSGVRNAFPPRLLALLDHLNRWLYSPRSPLNGFTRRRRMRVTPRKPEGTPSGRRLLNGSGIGLVELDAEGVPWRIRELLGDGSWVRFCRRDGESRWD